MLLSLLLPLQADVRVLIWDNDNMSTVTNPDTWQRVCCESGLKKALTDNGIAFDSVDHLPADLSAYDILMVTLGVWCLRCGATPPGAVGAEEWKRIFSFLDEGKALYIEGTDVLAIHAPKDSGPETSTRLGMVENLEHEVQLKIKETTVGDPEIYQAIQAYLGCELAPDSVGVVKKVNSTLESVWSDFYYCNRGESDYSVDVLRPTSGTAIFVTDEDKVCVVAYAAENGSRVITSSIIFSALFDEEQYTKKALMQRHLGFMLWEKKLLELFANHISIRGIHIGRSVSNCVSWMKNVLSRLSRLNCYVLQKKQTLDIEKR